MYSNHINYIELYATDLEVVKDFYSKVFGWSFTDYGDSYTAFSNAGIDGGFEKVSEIKTNGMLVVLYHADLEEVRDTITQHGGTIARDIFSFPGGRRFHFKDPVGNELAIWSEKAV